jgi:hypothetical protein
MNVESCPISGVKRRWAGSSYHASEDNSPPIELALLVQDAVLPGYLVAVVIDVHSLAILTVHMIDARGEVRI